MFQQLNLDGDAIEEAADDLLVAFSAAEDRREGFISDHAAVVVAALADAGWSVSDVLAFGEHSELAGLLPESQRGREQAEAKARTIANPWHLLRRDLLSALQPRANQARLDEERDLAAAEKALDALPRTLRASAPRSAAARAPEAFADLGPVAAAKTLPGDLGSMIYAEGATVWFGEPEHGKSLAAQAAAVEAMRAGMRVVHLDGEQGTQDAGPVYAALGVDPAELTSLGLLHYEYDDALNFDGAYLAGLAPSLVIVDSFARLAAARGITDAQYAAQGNLMNELQAFGLRNACAVLVIDHTTKSPGKGDRYAVGGGSKLGAARGQYFVKRERKFTPDKAGVVSFTNVKGRRPGLPSWLRLEVGGEGYEKISFRPSLDKSVPADRIELDVHEFVRAQAVPLSRNKIRQAITGKNDVIDAATDRLVARGVLREVRTGAHAKFEATPEAPES